MRLPNSVRPCEADWQETRNPQVYFPAIPLAADHRHEERLPSRPSAATLEHARDDPAIPAQLACLVQ